MRSVIRTLDSGDDEDRQDQLDEKENDEPETDEIAEKRLMEVTLSPTVTPKGSDGQVCGHWLAYLIISIRL